MYGVKILIIICFLLRQVKMLLMFSDSERGRCCETSEIEKVYSKSINNLNCDHVLHNTSKLFGQPTFPNWPEFLPGPCIFDDVRISYRKPTFSILMTVFNRENIIRVTLVQLLKLTTEPWELIMFFDGTTDSSIQATEGVFSRYKRWSKCAYKISDINVDEKWNSAPDPSKFGHDPIFSIGDLGAECRLNDMNDTNTTFLTRYRFLLSPKSGILPTAANNFLMRMSDAEFFILFDDDQLMTQYGWNSLLAFPMKKWDDVFSISMMCAHSVAKRICRNTSSLNYNDCELLSTVDNFQGISSCRTRDKSNECMFIVRDSGIRGPLLIRSLYAKELGYLDEINHLGHVTIYCDHDLNMRAYSQRKWKSGYLPIPFTESRCCRSPYDFAERQYFEKYVSWWKSRRDQMKVPRHVWNFSVPHDEIRSLRNTGYWLKLCA